MYTVSYPGSGVVRSLVSMMIAVVLGMTSAYANSSVAPDQLISSLFEVINKRLNDDIVDIDIGAPLNEQHTPTPRHTF